jgi:murein DD-endopeptidase MepM/ murein hydrolase activator NlpD
MLAVGMVFPVVQATQADTPDGDGTEGSTSATSSLTISVETVDQLTGLTAVVSTGGENVNLRQEATDNSESLAKIADGTVVSLRVDMIDTVYDDADVRWWPVSHEGIEGWISGEYLTQATTADGDIVSPNLVAFDYTDQADEHSTAKVFGNGQNVNVRSEPSATSEIVTKAADGQVISLRIDTVDTVYDAANTRWWPVVVNGEEGWISGFYLTDSNGAPTTQPGEEPSVPTETTEATNETATEEAPTEAASTETPASEEPGDSTFSVGDFAQVFTGDGSPINVRESGSPDAPVIGGLDDGEVVEIVSGPIASDGSAAGWYEVRNANITGFVDGDLLITSVESAGQTPASTEPPLSEEEEATVAATQTPATTPEATTEPEATEAPTEEPEEESSAQFIYPLEDYRRTQGFGCSNLGFYSYNAEYGCPVHNGLDLAASSGTPIMAAGSGTVVTAGWCNCGLGYYVEIDHGNGLHTLYGHMASQPYVSAGQSVSQGDAIGPVGSTGISTGPHVHFMVTVNGTARNPENYLP